MIKNTYRIICCITIIGIMGLLPGCDKNIVETTVPIIDSELENTNYAGNAENKQNTDNTETLYDETSIENNANNDSDETVIISLAIHDDYYGVIGQSALAFKAQLEELSSKSIIVEIQPEGRLGNDDEILDRLNTNSSLDMAIVRVDSLKKYGCELSQALYLPYLFMNREHFRGFIGSKYEKEMLEETIDAGNAFMGIGMIENGFSSYYSNKKIWNYKSLKNQIIGIPDDDNLKIILNTLEATGEVIAADDKVSSCENDLIDGSEGLITEYYDNKYNETFRYIYFDQHTFNPYEIVIRTDKYKELTIEQKVMLQKAIAYTEKFNYFMSVDFETRAFENMENSYVITVPKDKEKIELYNLCKEEILNNNEKYREIYENIHTIYLEMEKNNN